MPALKNNLAVVALNFWRYICSAIGAEIANDVICWRGISIKCFDYQMPFTRETFSLKAPNRR